MVWTQLSSGGRRYLCNHVINQAVLVPDTKLLKLVLIAIFIQLLENLQESAVIDLQNGVLCGQVQGPAQTCKSHNVSTSASDDLAWLTLLVINDGNSPIPWALGRRLGRRLRRRLRRRLCIQLTSEFSTTLRMPAISSCHTMTECNLHCAHGCSESKLLHTILFRKQCLSELSQQANLYKSVAEAPNAQNLFRYVHAL